MTQRSKQGEQIGRQEGSRWINRRPEPDELARWFSQNVRIAEGLSHAHYFPGLTLIPNKEKVKTVVVGAGGNPEIVDVEQLVFTPYPKVETREMYFWDYCELHGYLGEIELVPTEPNKHLPEGFFHMPVSSGEGRGTTPFVGVSYQVRIWRDQRRTRPVRIPPAGTKVVPLLKRGYNGVSYADENAVLRAQTGAIGRALGYAGMLVVPGAGVATAEDMLEYLATGASDIALPGVVQPSEGNGAGPAEPAELEEIVKAQIVRLESEFPAQYEEARAWAAEKGFALDEPPADSLRSLERLLRRKLESAEAAAAKQPEPSVAAR